MGREEDKEMTYQLPPQAKQGQFGANVFNAFPVKIVLNSEEQMQKLKLSPQPHPFFPGSNSSLFSGTSTLPLMNHAGEDGECGQRVQFLAVSFCCSFLLTL